MFLLTCRAFTTKAKKSFQCFTSTIYIDEVIHTKQGVKVGNYHQPNKQYNSIWMRQLLFRNKKNIHEFII